MTQNEPTEKKPVDWGSVAGIGIFVIGWAFILANKFFKFNNDLSKNFHNNVSAAWTVIGFVLLGAGFYAWFKIDGWAKGLIAFAALALGICAFAGFRFLIAD